MYELLCFSPAYPGGDDKQVLSSIITRDPIPPKKIASSVPPELETICLKALEKAPDARYATARAFADDVRRYTHDLPIVAKRPGPVARTMKFVRRHKVQVIAAMLVLTVGAVGFVMVGSEKGRRIKAQAAERASGVARLVASGIRELDARNWNGAVQFFQAAINSDPSDFAALGNYATTLKALYNNERYGERSLLEEAMKACDTALAAPQTEASLTDDEKRRLMEQKARLHNLKGVLLKMIGRYPEAIEFYESAIRLNDKDDAAWENLGTVHALSRNLVMAEKDLRQATELVGDDATKICQTSWRSLASLLMLRGDPEAGPTIERALGCRSDDSWSALIRARLRLSPGAYRDFGGAGLDADHAMRDVSNKGIPFRRLVLRTTAQAFLRNERYSDAIHCANQAIAAGGFYAINELIIAIAEAKLGRREEAEQALEQAIDHWPDDLKNPGDFRPTAPEGVLWFETADELLAWRAEVEALLRATPP